MIKKLHKNNLQKVLNIFMRDVQISVEEYRKVTLNLQHKTLSLSMNNEDYNEDIVLNHYLQSNCQSKEKEAIINNAYNIDNFYKE